MSKSEHPEPGLPKEVEEAANSKPEVTDPTSFIDGNSFTLEEPKSTEVRLTIGAALKVMAETVNALREVAAVYDSGLKEIDELNAEDVRADGQEKKLSSGWRLRDEKTPGAIATIRLRRSLIESRIGVVTGETEERKPGLLASARSAASAIRNVLDVLRPAGLASVFSGLLAVYDEAAANEILGSYWHRAKLGLYLGRVNRSYSSPILSLLQESVEVAANPRPYAAQVFDSHAQLLRFMADNKQLVEWCQEAEQNAVPVAQRQAFNP